MGLSPPANKIPGYNTAHITLDTKYEIITPRGLNHVKQ